MILQEDDYVEHFGKKGMRWGVRKASKESSPPKKSRKEVKADKKAARTKADQEYTEAVHKLVSGASKRGNLVELRTGNRSLILTGEEAANMIMQRKGAVPRNVMWNELELDRGKG